MQGIEPSNKKTSDNGSNANDNPYGPIMDSDGNYNDKAHYYLEEKRVERDLTIKDAIESLGALTCNFVRCRMELGGTKTVLIYHPNPTGVIGDKLEWIEVPALLLKSGGKLYKKAANERIEWRQYILKGDILGFVTTSFGQAIVNGDHVNNLEEFVKKVAKFIFDYPHDETTTYGCYVMIIIKLIRFADRNINHSALHRIGVAMCVGLKRVLSYNDRNITEIEVYKKVRNVRTRLTAQDCSKKTHYQISQIDKQGQIAEVSFEELDRLAQEEAETERKEKEEQMRRIMTSQFNMPEHDLISQARPLKAIEPKKRQITEVYNDKEEDEEKGPGKYQRTESEEAEKEKTDIVLNVQEEEIEDEDVNYTLFKKHLEGKKRREEETKANNP